MSQTTLDYINVLMNQPFTGWSMDQIIGYKTAATSIREFISKEQTTFTIEEISNWLQYNVKSEKDDYLFNNLSAENIIKVNHPDIVNGRYVGNDHIPEGPCGCPMCPNDILPDELDTVKSMDYELHTDEGPAFDYEDEGPSTLPQSFTVSKDDEDKIISTPEPDQHLSDSVKWYE
jgi:hypothetical protein